MVKVPFAYGWIILVAAATGAFAATVGQTVGVAAFFDPIVEDVGISRGEAALAYSLGTLIGILPAPFIGRWIDRRGVQPAALAIGLGVAFACVGITLVNNTVLLTIGFAALRGSAVGGLALLSSQIINLWFVRRRGVAAAAVVGGGALGGVVYPVVTNGLLEVMSWREVYLIAAGITALVVTPLLVLTVRDKPERFGLRPDFDQSVPAVNASAPKEPVVTLHMALRTSSFWILTLAGFLSNMIGTALLLHQVSILTSGGFTRNTAVTLLAPMAWMQALAILTAGLLIDRFGVRCLLPALLAVLAAAAVLSSVPGSIVTGAAYAAALGIALGGLNTVQAAGYAEAFGRTNMGAIRGVASVASVVGAALGPLPPIISLSVTGSYGPALWGFASAAILAALTAALLLVRSPALRPKSLI
ncbi:MFS family permease [Afipia massiliensis]|uniref:MFS family permease n=1 Tax=Afipia massiliensis TaxID=211460 RepID=A0A840NBP8_9BRAD|nr:MFS transporter [Afipia massiliensis]MBB5055071.1 MFS family permease [Afipia massiliensis]